MRSPEQVLKALNKHGKVSDYKFERLYRILFNEEMFHVAYQRIYAKPGNMTPGTDGKTINRMSLQRINKVIASLRDESYKPNPAKRIYIPKKNGKKRPLGIPSFEDKLVQEVVRMISAALMLFANTLLFSLRLDRSGSFPRPLSASEERMWLERLAQGDPEARNVLIERNLRLVAHIVKKMCSKMQISLVKK